jgi:hypothetical protein
MFQNAVETKLSRVYVNTTISLVSSHYKVATFENLFDFRLCIELMCFDCIVLECDVMGTGREEI